MEIPHAVLERQTLCFSSYKNHKLKVKLRWLGTHGWKKKAFFVPFILSEGNLFNRFILSQCVVYGIHFQDIYTFTYQTLLSTRFWLFLKSSKAFRVSLITNSNGYIKDDKYIFFIKVDAANVPLKLNYL